MAETMRQVLVRMPKPMLDELKKRAETEDRTVAAEVRRALRRYLGTSNAA